MITIFILLLGLKLVTFEFTKDFKPNSLHVTNRVLLRNIFFILQESAPKHLHVTS